MRKREKEKKKPSLAGSIFGLILTLVMLEPEAWVILGAILLIGLIAFPVVRILRRRKHISGHQKQLRNTTYVPCEEQRAFDEQSRDLFCFHKDKAVHHVRRGKEIDPWDRPDIDISKYQRQN